MCDYSLHVVASRPAKAGDKLETTSFYGTTTRGFAAVGEPNVAVCLLPGTEIAFEQEVEYCRGLGFVMTGRSGHIGYVLFRFRHDHRHGFADEARLLDRKRPMRGGNRHPCAGPDNHPQWALGRAVDKSANRCLQRARIADVPIPRGPLVRIP